MNTTFWTWLAVAVGVGGVLLLLLATPATEQASPLVLEETGTAAAVVPATQSTQYWAPVTGNSTAVQPVASAPVRPCSTCGASSTAATVSVVRTVPVCSSCARQVPSTPCGASPCSGIQAYQDTACGTCGTTCGGTCAWVKPGINRNMNLCVDECTFIQLHATIPHPICSNVCFEWSASKGSFLDPKAADPVFYAPTTQFPGGEDVWIVVKITDGSGAQYTDQVKVHVVNLR